MFPGTPTFGPAGRRPDRCLPLLLNDTRDAGSLIVMSRSTAACTFDQLPASLPIFTDFLFATVSVIMEREDSLSLAPPMPALEQAGANEVIGVAVLNAQ